MNTQASSTLPAILRAGRLPVVAAPLFIISVPELVICLLYTSPSPRDYAASRMPSSA